MRLSERREPGSVSCVLIRPMNGHGCGEPIVIRLIQRATLLCVGETILIMTTVNIAMERWTSLVPNRDWRSNNGQQAYLNGARREPWSEREN